MEGGGSIIIEAARKAAAAARTERAARVAAMRPVAVRNYHGVHLRRNRYCAAIWNVHTKRMLWLGSYETPEEAAYAYDAAARATRGHRARPNFPEPAPEKVSTDLVLPLPTPTPTPTPAAGPARRELPPVPLQACFDNWLMAGLAAAQRRRQQEAPAPPALFPRQQQQQRPAALPPFTQFFHLAGPATAAAAGGGAAGAAVVNHPSVPGAYILTPQNVQVPPANPASTELSSTDPVPVVVRAWQFFPAAAPIQHRELPVPQAIVVSNSDAVVADNFHLVASMSSAAPPPLPQLTLMDLAFRLGLPGRGGPGGAAH